MGVDRYGVYVAGTTILDREWAWYCENDKNILWYGMRTEHH
jgi:hypothetical protein